MVLKRNDWVGRTFGRLTVIDLKRYEGAGSVLECQCECGVITLVKANNLKRGTTSCGCLALEVRTTHGKTGSKVYTAWKAMKYRCTNTNAHEYHNYGGRGITVCDSWLESFENFYADMGDPAKGLTLERVDNDKGYSKENCIWDTYEAQENNKSTTLLLTAFGKTQSLTQWSKEYNLPFSTLKNRLYRAYMKPEDALTAPLYRQQRSRRK